jgi:hypothetical protein
VASVVWWLACCPLVPKIAGSLPTENPQHAFLRRGSKIMCPMSQLWGMLKNPALFEKLRNFWPNSISSFLRWRGALCVWPIRGVLCWRRREVPRSEGILALKSQYRLMITPTKRPLQSKNNEVRYKMYIEIPIPEQ